MMADSKTPARLASLRLRGALAIVVVLAAVAPAACTIVWQRVAADEIVPAEGPRSVSTPVRAYLADGSIVVLPDGAAVRDDRLVGTGTRHEFTLETARPFQSVSLDSVVAVETFRQEHYNQWASALVLVGGAAGSVLLAMAIFGSCPTIYAEVDGETLLQAEPFSYSISPLYEARDVHRLTAAPDEDGVLRLELRNEALETHYINHMEILEATRGEGEEVIPEASGRPMALGGIRAPLAARDRDGRDVLQEVAYSDGVAFRSSRDRLAAATEADFTDWMELEIPPAPLGAEEVGLILRLRNTLLNTVLFYDVMLAGSGIQALEWLGTDLHRIGTAAELARWYRERMGLRVEVEVDGDFVEVAYLPDQGPIAWTDRVVVIPASAAPSRVRLSFPSDSWFIDRIAVAFGVSPAPVRRIPVARAVRADGAVDPEVPDLLAAPDEEYLVTRAGERMWLEFEVHPQADGTPRTFLLATQGYYVEWIRGSWLARDEGREAFRPSDGAVIEAMRRWERVMDDFERDFHASRIPAR